MHIGTENIKRAIKRLWIWLMRKDALIYLLFVALVTLFWWGHSMTSQREIVVKIPIIYTDIPAEVVFTHPLPTTLKSTIRDNGRHLRYIQHTQPSLTINIAQMLNADDSCLLLSTDIIRQKVQDMLPGSTTIQQISPEEISATYYVEHKKCVPIRLRAQWTLGNQYQLVTPPTIQPEFVDIYGELDIVNAIDTINTDSIIIEDIQGTVKKEISLILPEGVRCLKPNTIITCEAEQFTEKTFILPIEVTGLPQGEKMQIFPQTTTVIVRVGISHFSDVVSEDFRAVCNYPLQQSNTLPIEIINNNPHVTKVRSNIREVEYLIER